MQFTVIRNHRLRKWLVPSHNDVTALLVLAIESRRLKRPDALASRDLGQSRHTAISCAFDFSSGTGRPSNSKAST